MEVVGGDGVGVEQRIGLVRRRGAPGPGDAAVDDEMGDVDSLRREFARHALRQAAQRELAHGERRRLRVALHARRGAGEKDRTALFRDHAARRLLRDQEAAERAHRQRALDLRRVEVRDRPAHPGARVVHHDVGLAERLVHGGEELPHLGRIHHVASESARAGFLAQRGKLVRVARRQRDAHALAREQPGQRGAQPLPRSYDQRPLVTHGIHARLPISG